MSRPLFQRVREVEVESVTLWEGGFRLRTPFRTARGELSERRAIFVQLACVVDGLEVPGYGQAAPIPGWSEESLRHVAYDLDRVADAVHRGARCLGWQLLEMARPPSARFALELALLDAVGRAAGMPIRRLLDDEAPNAVALNATIGVVPIAEATTSAINAAAAGYAAIKMKVGDAEDVARVRAVREALPNAVLRLDANRAWTVEAARERLALLSEVEPQYVEEPCDDLRALGPVPVPLAADESCAAIEAARALVDDRLVSTLVLKPALLGSIESTLSLAAHADDADVRCVFTSALDPCVGRSAVAQLAAGFDRNGVAMGLGMTKIFEHDVGSEEVVIDAMLHLGSGAGIGYVPNFDGLRKRR